MIWPNMKGCPALLLLLVLTQRSLLPTRRLFVYPTNRNLDLLLNFWKTPSSSNNLRSGVLFQAGELHGEILSARTHVKAPSRNTAHDRRVTGAILANDFSPVLFVAPRVPVVRKIACEAENLETRPHLFKASPTPILHPPRVQQ